jgi:hypothetical protein
MNYIQRIYDLLVEAKINRPYTPAEMDKVQRRAYAKIGVTPEMSTADKFGGALPQHMDRAKNPIGLTGDLRARRQNIPGRFANKEAYKQSFVTAGNQQAEVLDKYQAKLKRDRGAVLNQKHKELDAKYPHTKNPALLKDPNYVAPGGKPPGLPDFMKTKPNFLR